MFEGIIEFAESASALNPLLTVLIKIVAFVFFATLALAPLSLVGWLLHWMIREPTSKALQALNDSIQKVKNFSQAHFTEATNTLQQQLDKTSYFISFDVPEAVKQPVETSNLVSALNSLTKKLIESPDLAKNSESKKEELITSVNNKLDDLARERDIIRTPRIPQVSASDAEAKLKKSNARSSLWVFLPLSVLAIVINTLLLNLFFEELFYRKEIFGVPYSLGISAIFSVIEIGIGILLGHQSIASAGRPLKVDVLPILCWMVIAALVLIESALYFSVGTKNPGGLSEGESFQLISQGEYLVLFLEKGAWFTLIGPAIVLSLYLFGHRLAEAYFEYRRYSTFDSLSLEMDLAHKKSTEFKTNIEQGEQRALELLEKIRAEDLTLNNVEEELHPQVEEYAALLRRELINVSERAKEAEKAKVEIPEISVRKLGPEEGANLHRESGFYLTAVFLAVISGVWVFPSDNLSFLPSGYFGSILLSSLITIVCMLAGNWFQSKVEIIRTLDDEVAALAVDKIKAVHVVLTVSGALGLLLIYWYAFNNQDLVVIKIALAALLNLICFYSGMKLSASLPFWSTYAIWTKDYCLGLIGLLYGGLLKILSLCLDLLCNTLALLATPSRSLIGERL